MFDEPWLKVDWGNEIDVTRHKRESNGVVAWLGIAVLGAGMIGAYFFVPAILEYFRK